MAKTHRRLLTWPLATLVACAIGAQPVRAQDLSQELVRPIKGNATVDASVDKAYAGAHVAIAKTMAGVSHVFHGRHSSRTAQPKSR